MRCACADQNRIRSSAREPATAHARVGASGRYAALRASPEVQRRECRQPPQRPRHSRPAVLPEVIPAAAGQGSEMSSTRSGRRRGMRQAGCSLRLGLSRECNRWLCLVCGHAAAGCSAVSCIHSNGNLCGPDLAQILSLIKSQIGLLLHTNVGDHTNIHRFNMIQSEGQQVREMAV